MPIPTLTEGSMDRQTKRTSTAPKLVLEPVRESSRLDSHPLATGRYLIGSSPECDIVLAIGGVAPQHCLLIVGVNKTIVKAISPLTWINDGPLTEAVLKHGERLILGPVELRTRRPEVTEWIELREPEPARPTPAVSYEPPRIEELLDHARQQLQSVIDEPPSPAEPGAEELSLAGAVRIHSASAEPVSPVSTVPPLLAHERELLSAAQRERQQQELEFTERSRALEYLGSELSTREAQLRSRESTLNARQSQVEHWLTEFEQRQQAIAAQEHALQVRNEAEATASRMIAEQTRSLEDEQLRLRQLSDSVRGRESDLERQALALAEQTQAVEAQEIELRAQAASRQQQAQTVQTFAAVTPVDTSAVELREAAVAQREALLTSSLAALQTTRQQISREANDLEQRFTELLHLEQSMQSRESALAEQASQAEARIREATALSTGLVEREQAVAASLAAVSEREATLQQRRSDVDGRERELRGLRSELDIREESLNQQFSQLQLDRSALRAAQSKLQLAEQSANQRLVDLDWTTQQRTNEQVAELEQRRQELAAQAAEWEAKTSEVREHTALIEARHAELESHAQDLAEREQTLVDSARLLTERERELTEAQSPFEREQAANTDHAPHDQSTALVADRTEIDNEWQSLAGERARLASERHDFEEARSTTQAEKQADREPQVDSAEVSDQLLALVSERQSLAQLREELLQEQLELRAEREETRRARDQFDLDHEQLLAIKSESSSERDTYLMERQALISERQSLEDRERQIQQAEAEVEQLRLAAAERHAEAETTKQQMTTQRRHLDEEWGSLRQERAEHQQAEAELDVQREELTLLAQQLTDLQVEEGETYSEPAKSRPSPQDRVSEVSPVARVQAAEVPLSSESIADHADQDSDTESPDPLAGFASFSSIGDEVDADLPPEIAALLQRLNGPVPAVVDRSAGESFLESKRPVMVSAKSPIDDQEEQRLRDLFGRSSESSVEVPQENVGVEAETYEVVEDQWESASALATERDSDHGGEEQNWFEADPREPHPVEIEDRNAAQRQDRTGTPETAPASVELRSRLSDMFGIDLSRLRQPGPQHADHVPSPSEESLEEAQAQVEDSYEPELAEQSVEAEQTPELASVVDESLDPVAAYMEQLLARTRKSRDSGQAKAVPAAPKPVKPVIVREEPKVQPISEPEPEPEPVRQTRKLEAVDKLAMRANLDSFRTIANTRARSDVARSELRRLKITEKLKHVFLAISGGIALILISTELWTTRRYRLEMSAALLATAFLGWDYFRTQKRLRELESIAPVETDTVDEAEESEGA